VALVGNGGGQNGLLMGGEIALIFASMAYAFDAV
jgi:hypothetical protein